MRSSSNHDEAEQALQAYMGRIARLIRPDGGGIDPRDAVILMHCGAIREEEISTDTDVDRLRAATREERDLGPLLFYPEQDDSRSVIRLRDLILDGRSAVRELAIKHLEKMGGVHHIMCRRTFDSVSRLKVGIARESQGGWRPDAVELVDAIDADWLLTVAGVRQSRHSSMGEVWSDYINAALRPTPESINACAPCPLHPTLHANDVERSLRQLRSNALSLEARCERYVEVFGHLPLAGNLSLRAMAWPDDEVNQSETKCKEIMQWATRSNRLEARYHACEVLLPYLVELPSEERERLSAWFWEIVFASSRASESEGEVSLWDVAEQVARYFVHYLELRVPTSDGDATSAMAWWMTFRLVASFSGDPRHFAQQFYQVYGGLAQELWELVGPVMTPSVLRWLTLYGPSPWTMSVLAAVKNEEQASLLLEGPGRGTRTERADVLVGIALQTANLPFEQSEGVYRFAARGVQRMIGWITEQEPEGPRRSMLRGWSDHIDWSPPESLSSALTDIGKKEVAMQRWLCHAIRQRIFTGAVNGDDVWDIVSMESWRFEWNALDSVAIQAIGSGIIEDAARRRPDWWPNVPHLFSIIAEERDADRSDEEAVFGLLLRACFALHAPSALSRLLRGGAGHRYRPLATAVRGNLERGLPAAGGWAAGRIRAMLVELTQ